MNTEFFENLQKNLLQAAQQHTEFLKSVNQATFDWIKVAKTGAENLSEKAIGGLEQGIESAGKQLNLDFSPAKNGLKAFGVGVRNLAKGSDKALEDFKVQIEKGLDFVAEFKK